jgi:hypothetical protein
VLSSAAHSTLQSAAQNTKYAHRVLGALRMQPATHALNPAPKSTYTSTCTYAYVYIHIYAHTRSRVPNAPTVFWTHEAGRRGGGRATYDDTERHVQTRCAGQATLAVLVWLLRFNSCAISQPPHPISAHSVRRRCASTGPGVCLVFAVPHINEAHILALVAHCNVVTVGAVGHVQNLCRPCA